MPNVWQLDQDLLQDHLLVQKSEVSVVSDWIRKSVRNNYVLILIWFGLLASTQVLHFFFSGWIAFGVALALGTGAFFIRDHARKA